MPNSIVSPETDAKFLEEEEMARRIEIRILEQQCILTLRRLTAINPGIVRYQKARGLLEFKD